MCIGSFLYLRNSFSFRKAKDMLAARYIKLVFLGISVQNDQQKPVFLCGHSLQYKERKKVNASDLSWAGPTVDFTP